MSRFSGVNRRTVLKLGAGIAVTAGLTGCSRRNDMTDRLWKQWQQDWRWMENIAGRRGWDLTPLAIAPPASGAAIERIEAAYGQRVPPQLRELLTQYSARVTFGWHVPSHLAALEKQELPTSSAIRDGIWSLDHIEASAIPNFLGWKQSLAQQDLSEAPNTPEMWEKQFPFYSLVNGDMLTIDASTADGPHPVRYFSHELEMLHGLALAPDFFSFVTEMSKLGFAGTEWASWMRFGRMEGDTFYLKADGDGGKAWRAWLERDPVATEPDEPPPTIVEATPVERALLEAARANNAVGVRAALATGARADVVWNGDWLMASGKWDEEFSTALTYAARHDNTDLLDHLLKKGATLNTRRLPVSDAVATGSLATVQWLIGHGARVNGWKDERYFPIHRLVTQRSRYIAPDVAALQKRLREEEEGAWSTVGAERDPAMRQVLEDILQQQLTSHIDAGTYLAMLDALLTAGARPDARWDNGTTMLMWAEPDAAKVLLKHGADVDALATGGWTALHYARTPEKVRVLVAHGADINRIARPEERGETDLVFTPLQAALLGRSNGYEIAKTLLELGAEPGVRDLDGRSTLCYCTTIESFKLIRPLGLDPMERLPDGGTLLHNLLKMTSVRATFPQEIAMLDFLLGLGLDINATDTSGQTMLHVAAAKYDVAADMQLLLDRGADPSIKDAQGKRAHDLVRRSLTDIRDLLK